MANPNKILFSFSHFPYQPNKVNLYLFFILPTNTYPVKFSQFYIPSIYYKVRIYQRESDHYHLGLIWLGVIIVEMENEGEKIVRESVWLRGENERENGGATILGNFGISLIFGKNVGWKLPIYPHLLSLMFFMVTSSSSSSFLTLMFKLFFIYWKKKLFSFKLLIGLCYRVMRVNLYKLTFFIISFFFSIKQKIFFISLLFHPQSNIHKGN